MFYFYSLTYFYQPWFLFFLNYVCLFVSASPEVFTCGKNCDILLQIYPFKVHFTHCLTEFQQLSLHI